MRTTIENDEEVMKVEFSSKFHYEVNYIDWLQSDISLSDNPIGYTDAEEGIYGTYRTFTEAKQVLLKLLRTDKEGIQDRINDVKAIQKKEI